MRVAIVYDCLYPYTIGGAERWYRNLAERLAARHEVTYLTRRQWSGEAPPDPPPGVRVVALGGARDLYTRSGRRRIVPPIHFGLAVLAHLVRQRGRYDVVHTCGFPYFPQLGAALARRLGGAPVVTDWLEIWPRRYWREYLGPIGGRFGEAIQALAIRTTRSALVASRLQAERLVGAGYRGEPILLPGLYADDGAGADPCGRRSLVVFIGRHIPEKRVCLIPAAIAEARRRIPDLEAILFGDGPERPRLRAEISRLGLEGVIRAPGFAPWVEVDAALRQALCLVLPSRREGYGLSIVEAAARGTPSIVTRDCESAAVELIDPGVNGFIVEEATVGAVAGAIEAVHADRRALGERTLGWFEANRKRLSIDGSVAFVERLYEELSRR